MVSFYCIIPLFVLQDETIMLHFVYLPKSEKSLKLVTYAFACAVARVRLCVRRIALDCVCGYVFVTCKIDVPSPKIPAYSFNQSADTWPRPGGDPAQTRWRPDTLESCTLSS